MPFPLAHPAAVLPLRRFCPRQLDFPALIIGSLVPDIGYCFPSLDLGEFSHRFLSGAFCFDLPVGLLLCLVFYSCRRPATGLLPDFYRQAISPLCCRPVGLLWTIAVSLLVGTWTHLLLDSFTHGDGWLVEHLPSLQQRLHGRLFDQFPIFDCLYYIFTFCGSGWLAYAYLRWLEISLKPSSEGSMRARWIWSLLFAGSTLLVARASRSPDQIIGILPTCLIMVLLVVVFVAGSAIQLREDPKR